MLKLDCLAAKHGDCLMVQYGDPRQPGFILIDGGPRGVYRKHLKKRLRQLRDQFGNGKPLKIELGMVSHIDDDHIQGLIELTDEIVAEPVPDRELVEFERFWHNSFTDIVAGSVAPNLNRLSNAVTASLAVGGELPFEALRQGDGRAASILASIGQGRTLRDNIEKLGLDGNRPFDGMVLSGNSIELIDGPFITVAGPLRARLVDLQQDWNPNLDPAEIASFTDDSVSNLASIVAHLDFEGKTILLTGDARGDDILAGLAEVGLLGPGGDIQVDVLKVPHHGSDHNVTKEFFEKVRARYYVISGDGKYDNPEPNMLTMLRDARGGDEYTLVFTNGFTKGSDDKRTEFERLVGEFEVDPKVTVMFREGDDHFVSIDLT